MVWAEHTELFFKSQEIFLKFLSTDLRNFEPWDFCLYRDSVRGSERK